MDAPEEKLQYKILSIIGSLIFVFLFIGFIATVSIFSSGAIFAGIASTIITILVLLMSYYCGDYSKKLQKGKQCPKCGKHLSYTTRYCSGCRLDFTLLKCSTCKKQMKYDDRYCPSCGSERYPQLITNSSFDQITHSPSSPQLTSEVTTGLFSHTPNTQIDVSITLPSRRCPFCQARRQESDVFCGHCGKSFVEVNNQTILNNP